MEIASDALTRCVTPLAINEGRMPKRGHGFAGDLHDACRLRGGEETAQGSVGYATAVEVWIELIRISMPGRTATLAASGMRETAQLLCAFAYRRVDVLLNAVSSP